MIWKILCGILVILLVIVIGAVVKYLSEMDLFPS